MTASRPGRWSAALVLVVALLTLSLPSVFAAKDTTPLEAVGSCIAAGGRGDVLLVIDTSGSLGGPDGTDPKAVRVAAAKYLVDELAVFAARTGFTIDVATAGFDTGYHPVTDWTRIDSAGAGSVKAGLDGFATRDTGLDTDYWAALDASRKQLSAKAAADPGVTHCPVWFWFSDGYYDIDPRKGGDLNRYDGPKPYAADNPLRTEADAQAAIEAGQADICRDGGQADQTVAAGVTTIAIGLQNPGADFALMKGISTGQGMSCGRLPARGEFYLANDLNDIFFAFADFAAPGSKPVVQTGKVCGGAPCAEGTHRFVLDSAIHSVRALASADVTGVQVQVASPAGGPVELTRPQGGTALAGAELTWQWRSDQTVQLVATRTADQGWSGVWSLVFIDPAASTPSGASKTAVQLTGDLAPAWAAAAPTLQAASVDLPLELQRQDGARVDAASLPSTLNLDAVLITRDGTIDLATDLAKSEIGTVTADLSGAALGPAELRLTLDLTTAPARTASGQTVPGTQLEPQVVSYPVTVVAAPNYPTLPDTVVFAAIEGAHPVTAELPVSGDGCVWLGEVPAPQGTPEGVQAPITSPAVDQAGCVRDALRLTITPSAPGNGSVVGTLTVMAAPGNGAGEPVAVPVTYRLEMTRPANQPLRIAVLAGVFVLGVLLPLAGLYLMKFLTARLTGDTVFVGSTSGPVGADGSYLDHSGPPVLNAMDSVAINGSRRELSLPGGRLRTAMGLAPTEPGYVRAEFVGRRAASSASPSRAGAVAAHLPLAVQNHWVAVLDARDPVTGPVEVVYLVAGGEQLADLHADACRHVPARVAQLRAGLPVPATVPPADPWGAPGGPTDDGFAGSAVPGPPPGWRPGPPTGPGGHASTGGQASTGSQASPSGAPGQPHRWGGSAPPGPEDDGW